MLYQAIQSFTKEAVYLQAKREEALNKLADKWILVVPVKKKEDVK